jgi:hypothetical protein
MLWIMYDLGFPTEAIDAVRNLYESATTQVKLPSSEVCTGQILIDGFYTRGHSLPFLFLLYMEPLLILKMVTRRRKGLHTYLCPKRKHASN